MAWRGRRDDSARTRGKILISARPLAGELVEGAQAAPEHAAAVVAARAPTTDVEGLEAVRASRRRDAPLAPNAPSERPPDAVEAEEKNSREGRADAAR